ncbi:MAG: hypothetical protein Q9213_003800 [Squamulea squamosa]
MARRTRKLNAASGAPSVGQTEFPNPLPCFTANKQRSRAINAEPAATELPEPSTPRSQAQDLKPQNESNGECCHGHVARASREKRPRGIACVEPLDEPGQTPANLPSLILAGAFELPKPENIQTVIEQPKPGATEKDRQQAVVWLAQDIYMGGFRADAEGRLPDQLKVVTMLRDLAARLEGEEGMDVIHGILAAELGEGVLSLLPR